MSEPKYSAAQYTAAIGEAIKASDVEAAYGLLTLMALDHPHEADDLRQTILLGLAVLKGGDA